MHTVPALVSELAVPPVGHGLVQLPSVNVIVDVSFIIFITEWKSVSLSFQGFIASLTISLSSLQAKGSGITFFLVIQIFFGSQVTLHKVCFIYQSVGRRSM